MVLIVINILGFAAMITNAVIAFLQSDYSELIAWCIAGLFSIINLIDKVEEYKNS